MNTVTTPDGTTRWSVEHFAATFRQHRQADRADTALLGTIEFIVGDSCWSDSEKLTILRSALAAAELVHAELAAR